MVQRIHHINLVVRDLELAVAAWQRSFGLEAAIREELPERGVRTARFRIGETWLVLVQPTRIDGEPGQRLAAGGEGVFLLSLEVGDLDTALSELPADVAVARGRPRTGVAGWKVQDLDAPSHGMGSSVLQLCEDDASDVYPALP
jgi:methylmalonyl-CoA/ethylmalonyl-CoA epimerase